MAGSVALRRNNAAAFGAGSGACPGAGAVRVPDTRMNPTGAPYAAPPMDDRDSRALWLALSPDGVDVGGPGVQRVTQWTNAHPDRRDMPRRIDDQMALTIAEVDVGFSPRPGGWLFTRTARPAQGRLTDRPTTGLLIVLISPSTPADAQSLRDWADFVHISEIAATAVPGFTTITPYERADAGPNPERPRWLHFYEMDTDDPEAAFISMPRLVAQRIGKPGEARWDEWAAHPALQIDYVQTFRLATSRV
jgi:hypothetical protein